MLRFVIFSLVVVSNSWAADTDTDVVFVHVVARHGERAPVTRLANDPNDALWGVRPGHLTNKGKQQLLDLGQFLRRTYRDLLSNYTADGDIYARSTDKPRTLASAQIVMAGLYPPHEKEQWNDGLGKVWQPVPVHSLPANQDPFIDSYYHNCPRHDQYMNTIVKTPEGTRKYQRTLEILNATQRHSNFTWKDFHDFLDFGDVIHIQKKKELPMADWLQPFADEVDDLFTYFSLYYIKTKEEQQLAGGFHVNEIMNRMKDAIDGKLEPVKAYYYSAHDYAIMFIMAALDMFNGIVPPFISALIIELHEDAQGQHYVQMLYRNDSSVDPYPLFFAQCPQTQLCPWEKVWAQAEPLFITNMSAACVPYTDAELVELQKKLDQQFP